jgi:hypothetical protein
MWWVAILTFRKNLLRVLSASYYLINQSILKKDLACVLRNVSLSWNCRRSNLESRALVALRDPQTELLT